MPNHLLLLLCLLLPGLLPAQAVADFENFNLPAESWLNGDDGQGGFNSGDAFLVNNYTPEWDSWSGWAISNTTDIQTPGFANQYSAFAGSGADQTATYAVGYCAFGCVIRLEPPAQDAPVQGMYLTNSTYAALSLRDGDAFSKKFGGETGEDPDWFRAIIRAYRDGMPQADSLAVYLADFRPEDPQEDFILEDWLWVDLTPLGLADSLLLTLESTDNGIFGMNTPAYLCMDQLQTGGVSALDPGLSPSASLSIWPNPCPEGQTLHMNWAASPARWAIRDLTGHLIRTGLLATGTNALDARGMTTGHYIFSVLKVDRQMSIPLIIHQRN